MSNESLGRAWMIIATVITALIVALAFMAACELSDEMPRQCADIETRKTDPACAGWDV